MALVDFTSTDLFIGFPFSAIGGRDYLFNSTTFTFDALNDSYCLIFQAPRDGTIFDFEFRFAAGFTGTIRAGFVDMSGGGQWPGTTPTFSHYADFVNPTSGWKAPSGYIGTTGAGSGSQKSVQKGEIVCICWSCTAYTSGAATLQLWQNASFYPVWSRGIPYYGTNNAGAAWVSTVDSAVLSLYYDNAGSKESAATPMDSGIQPWNATETLLTIDSANPKMAGLKFRVPAEIAIDGAYIAVDPDATTTPRLVRSGTTTDLISATTLTSAQRANTGNCGIYIRFDAVTLLANTWYRLLLEQSSSATNVIVRGFNCNDTGDMAAAGAGADFHLTQSNTAFSSLTGTDATDYTDTTTSCPLIALHIAKAHDGTGSGGLAANPIRGFVS